MQKADTLTNLLQDSGDVEYYTDPEITAAARRVMGGIDLDPASSEIANRAVGATVFYTLADNRQNPTLLRAWGSPERPTRVWMNHPFDKGERACPRLHSGEIHCSKKICVERGYHIDEDRPGNTDWTHKLVKEYTIGNIAQSCCITFASTSEGWFKPLTAGLMCYLTPRTNYYLPNGQKKKGVTKGSVVTYFGESQALFIKEFSRFGYFPNLRTALRT